ncbi:MAG: hypothetical protein J7J52_04650 [Deltaproteobacteria bacterium]|nr:hypothetical protein [Deltaproteobacteria bacterium]
MPWDVGDVDRHKKGLTDAQKKRWVAVANSVLERCLNEGGTQSECEAKAIRQANSIAQRDHVVSFFKQKKEKQIAYGVVFEPEYVDADDEWISKDDIEDAAHEYLINYRNVKFSHTQGINDKVKVVESYIAPLDFKIGEHLIKEGSWIVAVKVFDGKLWKEIGKSLVGFSAGGTAHYVE